MNFMNKESNWNWIIREMTKNGCRTSYSEDFISFQIFTFFSHLKLFPLSWASSMHYSTQFQWQQISLEGSSKLKHKSGQTKDDLLIHATCLQRNSHSKKEIDTTEIEWFPFCLNCSRKRKSWTKSTSQSSNSSYIQRGFIWLRT